MMAGVIGGQSAGPDGPPTSATATKPTSNVELDWTNGDSDAVTEIGAGSSPGLSDPAYQDEVAAGVETYDTGYTDECPYWYVRHRKNGLYSAWVECSDSFTRAGC